MIDFKEEFPTIWLRKGAGGGDPRNGLCFVELASWMAGRAVLTDRLPCASPVLNRYGVALDDVLPDDVRQLMAPLALMLPGTRSDEHERGRLHILGVAACDIAEMVTPIYEEYSPGGTLLREVIKAARAYWAAPSVDTADAARDAAGVAAGVAGDAAWAADVAGARAARDAALAARAAWAAEAAEAAAWAAKAAEDAAGDAALVAAIWGRSVTALRDAILAGPHTEPDPVASRSRLAELVETHANSM